MKKQRTRKGSLFSKHLIFEKEMVPHIYNGGKNKRRRGFFKCVHHDNSYYVMTYDQAKATEGNEQCPCLHTHNGEYVYRSKDIVDVENYSYVREHNLLQKRSKETPAGWFKVSRFGILVEGELFYEFEKIDRSGLDYKTARTIENVTWNRPKKRKSFYLARLSYEYDRLHRDGLMNFRSDLWNRGAGREFFDEFLTSISQ